MTAYPYRVICFRASVADKTFRDAVQLTGYAGMDNKFLENMRRARDMVNRGRLDKVIAYHFLVPGADNWGAFRDALEQSGGMFPELACMLDVEDGPGKWDVRGDQTPLVKDWIAKAQSYFTNKQAVSIYLNFKANANLIVGITDLELRGVKLIVPGYHDPNKPPYVPAGIVAFGHQYTDKESTPPVRRNRHEPGARSAANIPRGVGHQRRRRRWPSPSLSRCPSCHQPPKTGLVLIGRAVPGLTREESEAMALIKRLTGPASPNGSTWSAPISASSAGTRNAKRTPSSSATTSPNATCGANGSAHQSSCTTTTTTCSASRPAPTRLSREVTAAKPSPTCTTRTASPPSCPAT